MKEKNYNLFNKNENMMKTNYIVKYYRDYFIIKNKTYKQLVNMNHLIKSIKRQEIANLTVRIYYINVEVQPIRILKTKV